jgi:hypothetical protein
MRKKKQILFISEGFLLETNSLVNKKFVRFPFTARVFSSSSHKGKHHLFLFAAKNWKIQRFSSEPAKKSTKNTNYPFFD